MKNIFEKLNSKKNKIIIGILAFLSMIGVISPVIEAYAHNAYFLAITIDDSKWKYNANIIQDTNNVAKHKEHGYGYFTNVKQVVLPASVDKDFYKELSTGVSDILPYSFPYYHETDLNPFDSGKKDAGPEDADRATLIADVVVNGLNDAIAFCYPDGFSSVDDFIKKSAVIANAVNGTIDAGNGVTLTFEENIEIPNMPKGMSKRDYVKITRKKGNTTDSRVFIYSMDKGYKKGQPLHELLTESAKKEENLKNDFEKINWKHVAFLGNYLMIVEGISFSQIETLAEPSFVEKSLAWLLDNATMLVRTTLGLSTMEDLMLNRGTRSHGYYYGIMPKNWFRSATSLNSVCQIIAWLLLIGAIVKLLASRNLSAINPTMRVNLMEGFMNLFLTGGLLAFSGTLFYFMAKMNFLIVDIFANSTEGMMDVTNQMTLGTGLIGMGLINIVLLIIMIYFNVIYIIRAIVLSLLFGTAPLFIVSIAFGSKYKQLFGNWVKETVSYIFMQSFHSIILAFFAFGGAMTTNGRLIESLIVAFSFVPLTKFFRQNLMGLSGGFGDQLSSSALGVGAKTLGSMLPSKGSSSSGSSNGSVANSYMSRNPGQDYKTASSSDSLQYRSMRDINEGFKTGVSESGTTIGGIGGAIKGVGQAGVRSMAELDANKGEIAKGIGGSLKEVGRNIPSVGADLAKGVGSLGVGIGLTSIGNTAEAGAFINNGGRAISGAVNGLGSSISGGYGKGVAGAMSMAQLGEKIDNSPLKEESLKNYGLTDDGSLAFSHDSEDFFNETGLNGIEVKNGMLSLSTGIDFESGEYSDDFIYTPGAVETIDMVNAFRNPSENIEKIQEYQSKGINVTRGQNGSSVINLPADRLGVKSVGCNNGRVNIIKENTSNTPVNNNFLSQVADLVPRD